MDIKGTRDGILISLEDLEWSKAKENLIVHIKANQSFFEGARLFLDVGNAVLKAKDLGELRDVLSSQGILLSGVLSKSLITRETAELLGLRTSLTTPKQKAKNSLTPLNTVLQGEPAVMIHRTMRSGFQVAYQGHVVVLGDVNPGAEIIASGSIIIWGKLRGTVHAGAEGDVSAVVCALELSPTQLRIATRIATSPKSQEKPQPEVASIKDDRIIAEPWHH